MQFITKFDIFSNYTIRQWFDKWGDTDILKLSNIFNLLSVYNIPRATKASTWSPSWKDLSDILPSISFMETHGSRQTLNCQYNVFTYLLLGTAQIQSRCNSLIRLFDKIWCVPFYLGLLWRLFLKILKHISISSKLIKAIICAIFY